MRRKILGLIVALLSCMGVATMRTASALPLLQLTPDIPSGQYVGTDITWIVATDEVDPVDFALSITAPDQSPRLMYDYTPETAFAWTPIDDGLYTFQVTMRNLNTGEVTTTTADFDISPRAVASPVVTATGNTLLALYSAPACAPGEQMRVVFRDAAGGYPTVIPLRPCLNGRSMNFYIAGMKPQTTYYIINQRFDANGGYLGGSPLRAFTTGTVPLNLPTRQVTNPSDPLTSGTEDLIFHSPVLMAPNWPNAPFATDMAGRIIWYNDKISPNYANVFRMTSEGTILQDIGDGLLRSKVWQEVDLAGNVVRQTSAYSMNRQLADLGFPPMGVFHHDSRRLPNGYTAVLATTERLMTDVQEPGEVDILGDYVLVLDENMQLVWVWDSFAHLDVYRKAILDEKCHAVDPWCLPLDLADVANDWLHINSIDYTPADHNLILSVRHQDWVVKLDYQDGAGSGAVVWRLGDEGDFALVGADGEPWPWLSHSHDASLIAPNTYIVYDNGNTRCDVGGDCTSRGQVYTLNEATMTATLVRNLDLGYYANGFGTAQRLTNGNYAFTSGTLSLVAPTQGVMSEVTPDGVETYAILVNTPLYRAYRMPDLYTFSGAITLSEDD